MDGLADKLVRTKLANNKQDANLRVSEYFSGIMGVPFNVKFGAPHHPSRLARSRSLGIVQLFTIIEISADSGLA